MFFFKNLVKLTLLVTASYMQCFSFECAFLRVREKERKNESNLWRYFTRVCVLQSIKTQLFAASEIYCRVIDNECTFWMVAYMYTLLKMYEFSIVPVAVYIHVSSKSIQSWLGSKWNTWNWYQYWTEYLLFEMKPFSSLPHYTLHEFIFVSSLFSFQIATVFIEATIFCQVFIKNRKHEF